MKKVNIRLTIEKGSTSKIDELNLKSAFSILEKAKQAGDISPMITRSDMTIQFMITEHEISKPVASEGYSNFRTFVEIYNDICLRMESMSVPGKLIYDEFQAEAPLSASLLRLNRLPPAQVWPDTYYKPMETGKHVSNQTADSATQIKVARVDSAKILESFGDRLSRRVKRINGLFDAAKFGDKDALREILSDRFSPDIVTIFDIHENFERNFNEGIVPLAYELLAVKQFLDNLYGK